MLQVDTAELRSALGALKGATSKRPGIPALGGVLVESDGQTARLTTSDLELTIRTALEATGEAGTMLVPFVMFAEAVKAHPAGRLTVDASTSAVSIGGASIRLLPAEDFPSFGEPGAYLGSFDAAELVRMIGAVVPACSRDEARPVLTGGFLELAEDGTATLTATDSYRLHTAAGRFDPPSAGVSWSAIVPARALAYLVKVLGRRATGAVELFAEDGSATFRTGAGVEIRIHLVEGEFPNFRMLIPEAEAWRQDGAQVTYDRSELEAAIAAGSAFCMDTAPLRFLLDPVLGVSMTASAPDLGAWSGRLVRATVDGDAVAVAYAPAYVGGAVKAVGDGASWTLRDGLKPGVWTSADGTIRALVMPVRLPVDAPTYVPAPEPAPADIHEPTAAEREAGEPVTAREPEPEPEPGNYCLEHDGHRTAGGMICDRYAHEGTPCRFGPEPEPPAPEDLEREAEVAGEVSADIAEARAALTAAAAEQQDRSELVRRLREGLPEPAEAEAEGSWAVVAEAGSTEGERARVVVRLVANPSGRLYVDVRRFVEGRRYAGRTRKGISIPLADAPAVAELIGEAIDAASAVE
jgi:DNA polymerase-3 subunit beta